ncbi:MAG: nitroreductase family protein [Pseudolabrys sp.]
MPTLVPEKVVREIVERAARAPSAGNMQPWRVYALAGQRIEELKALLAPRMAADLPKGEGTDYTIYPDPLAEPYRSRRFTVGELLYRSINVSRGDKPARYKQYARNYQFFGAPVALFFAREKVHGPAQWADIGGYLQTVALLARGFGLHNLSAAGMGLFPPHSACFSATSRQFDDLFGYGPRVRRCGHPNQFLALSARACRRFCVVRRLR